MGKKDKRRKRINIKRERQKLIKEKKKQFQKQDASLDKKATKEIDIRLEKETKIYWVRAITGVFSAFIGRLVGLVGWWLLIWMICFWFLTPFFVSFVIYRYKYDKEEWNWKNIIKPGIGVYFLLFMIVGVLTHTFLAFL